MPKLHLTPLAFGLVALSSCKHGGSPELTDPGDQTAVVGQQLTIELYATDPDGDDLDFSFAADGVPDLDKTTSLTIAPDGHGVFTFTPLASQLGPHLFDFTVSDGRNRDTVTINLEVTGAGGDGTLPVFRKPLGNGTVLSLESSECVEFDIEVTDVDSTQITLSQVPPTIQDAELTSDPSGLNGRWSWCPNREQIEAANRYSLTLSAQDQEDHPPTLKDYVVVLRRRSGADCPGEAPTVEHTPMDVTGQLDIPVEAHVKDDKGLKDAPILLFAYENPGNPIDYTKLTVVTMQLVGGDMQDGTWRGHIPNPTAPMGAGSEADVWYAISVNDNDDAEGDCDHLVDSPSDGTHLAHITNDGSGTAAVCGACSYDLQCGATNLCLPQQGGNFCGTLCAGDDDCEDDYVCSGAELQSVEGAGARQCVPTAGTCIDPGGGSGPCEEDDAEENDDIQQASTLVSLDAGVDYDAALCNGDSNDWFPFDLTNRGRVSAHLAGPGGVDMDLALTDAEGVLVTASTGIEATEMFETACLDPATYYLRIFAPSSASGAYTFGITIDTASCSGGGLGMGDCCGDTDLPGCEDLDVTACTCAIDSFCCDNEWDNDCAMLAQSSCGLECGGQMVHDCCTQGGPGCSDPAVEACVCAADGFCCDMEWDDVCVGKVGSLLCAEACIPDDADGPCCSPHAGSGCEVNAVEMCVCNADPVCCETEWDDFCIDGIANMNCGTCPG